MAHDEEYEDHVDIRCPECGSEQVVVAFDANGLYKVVRCNKCSYKPELE